MLSVKSFADTLQSSSPSHKLGIKGSFVIAAICKDGIIIASDSRGNVFDKTDKQQKPIAYFDTIQKILPIGVNAIAETGQGLILNIFFSAIIENFKRENPVVRVDQLLPTFISHCKRRFPLEAVIEMRKQKLFAAGYLNDSPTICYFNEEQPGGPFGCIQNSGFVESAPTLLSDHEKELPSLSSQEVAALTKKAIQEYANQEDRWKIIGGPISVFLITKTGSSWIENEPPQQRWTYVQDFVKEYRAGRVTIDLIPPTTKKQLADLLDTVPGVK